MRSLLIEEKDKTISEIIEKYLQKIWPKVYDILNGAINTVFGTIKRMFEIVLEQIGLTK